MPINATKATLLAALLLLSSAPAFAEDEGIQFFPPKNLEAGLGFLYFDAGGLGKQSVYAMPVQSQKLVEAVQQQTLAIMQQTEAIKTAQETSGWQCNWFTGGNWSGYGCVNTKTGATCTSHNGSRCP